MKAQGMFFSYCWQTGDTLLLFYRQTFCTMQIMLTLQQMKTEVIRSGIILFYFTSHINKTFDLPCQSGVKKMAKICKVVYNPHVIVKRYYDMS